MQTLLKVVSLTSLVMLSACGSSSTCPTAKVGGSPSAGKLAPLEWMAGAWHGTSSDGEIDEVWSNPSGRSMHGTSRTVGAGRTSFFEFMMVEERSAEVVFIAWPKAGTPTEFKLVEVSTKEVVFENPEKEFPRRIVYTHEADGMLHARAEGRVKGDARVDQYWLRPVR